MEQHSFERLTNSILELSESNDFDMARKEWSLYHIEISEEFSECLCGQPIKEHCYIRNNLNGNETYVGNVCINRFIKIDTGNLFEGLRRIINDEKANPNKDLIEHAYRMGYLYDEKEYRFLLDTMKKRKLTEAQLSWKKKINRRIVSKTVVRKRTS
ncbi:hypothetical protein J5069_03590 [Candidatus Symbiopectobacterium sp. NZEC127]|uniref:hypothetical protein n=1 Tax=Candidatus Symbiopectobacterium sp. NZEC127 TaxID=2820472 RepID=UPI0022267523|nr:hypothetical protein [Candidatus Symbiopectobacterium sp. NZEC127]MCW2484974.1 hypothetical protein [Candidatus Symbiopectobacterium sp. NZEC127]